MIAKLHEMGITPYMLSGDMQNVANAVAGELGIAPEHVFAEAFPERKVEVVKQLQESGKVIAFVGDGINDSAALAHASVSVSFAGATDMARETADIVLMDDDLSSLILAIQISKHAMRVVRQNAAIVVGPNVSGMVWAALIGVSPVVAVLINNGSAIAAEMNGFRPLMGPPGWQAAQGTTRSGQGSPSRQARCVGRCGETAIGGYARSMHAAGSAAHDSGARRRTSEAGMALRLIRPGRGRRGPTAMTMVPAPPTGTNGVRVHMARMATASMAMEPTAPMAATATVAQQRRDARAAGPSRQVRAAQPGPPGIGNGNGASGHGIPSRHRSRYMALSDILPLFWRNKPWALPWARSRWPQRRSSCQG